MPEEKTLSARVELLLSRFSQFSQFSQFNG
jgi:hypothetical protein